jgi:hypothetical protein
MVAMTTISLTPRKAIAKDKVLLSNERVFKLTSLSNSPKNSKGVTDPRLFTGENKLFIRCGPGNNLWTFFYKEGMVPPRLQQRFTSYQQAFNFAHSYFKGRNVLLEEDIDASAALLH